jgi:hypothetical protein
VKFQQMIQNSIENRFLFLKKFTKCPSLEKDSPFLDINFLYIQISCSRAEIIVVYNAWF